MIRRRRRRIERKIIEPFVLQSSTGRVPEKSASGAFLKKKKKRLVNKNYYKNYNLIVKIKK